MFMVHDEARASRCRFQSAVIHMALREAAYAAVDALNQHIQTRRLRGRWRLELDADV